MGRSSGALLIAPMGWKVAGRGRMVDGLEVDEKERDAVVLDI